MRTKRPLNLIGCFYHLHSITTLSERPSVQPTQERDCSNPIHVSGPPQWLPTLVLAFNAWLIDTPSWDNDGPEVTGRPPSYAGASLGGIRRLRGYPEGRFNSRSAIYYAAEFRYVPHWNRIANWSLLKRFNVDLDWLQIVGFAETGRVASEFDLPELHDNM